MEFVHIEFSILVEVELFNGLIDLFHADIFLGKLELTLGDKTVFVLIYGLESVLRMNIFVNKILNFDSSLLVHGERLENLFDLKQKKTFEKQTVHSCHGKLTSFESTMNVKVFHSLF